MHVHFWLLMADYYLAKIICKEPNKSLEKKEEKERKREEEMRENSKNFSKEADSIVLI